ncbi:MAG: hypothetical protein KFW09_05165 [Oscillospiraceae bacterium]|nr:hypothetical protein [Oscillospiraceae bacterium]
MNITLNKNTLTIEDDESRMSKDEINNLFNISKSKKIRCY